MAKKSEKIDNSPEMTVDNGGMRLEDASSVNPDDLKAAEGLNPRKEQLDAIYAARAKAIEKESNFGADLIKDSAVTDQDPEPLVKSHEDADMTSSVAPVIESPADNKPTPPVQDKIIDQTSNEEPLFTLKVDGVDLKLTKDQLIERAQKGIGAEKKFEEASRLREEAKNLIYGQPLQAQPPVQQNSVTQGHPVELDDSTVEDFLNKLNFGSKDEQKAAVKTLVSKAASQTSTAPQVPIDQIVTAATQNAVATMQSQQIMANLGNEFPDVFSDNLLSTAAGQLTNQLRDKYMQAGVQKSFQDISREALSTVRNKYIQKALESSVQQPSTNSSANVAPVVVQMDDKVAAKRAAPKPVVAVNKTAPAESSAPKFKAGNGKSDTVSWMRQSRGQPVYS